ncbi:MAG TPA: hypothetical protein VLM91_01765 [Candidatus Methylomirabilis sp.]|nr:hypothetical protein [Candidatus Methylomirabilis sp.]
MTEWVSRQEGKVLSTKRAVVGRRTVYSPARSIVLLATLAVAIAVLASPQPATAWRHGHVFVSPGAYVGYPYASSPSVLFPGVRPLPGYRFAFPPGAPLSYSDPDSGTTYCLSQPTGFYYECGYSSSAPYPVGPFPPMPPISGPPLAEQTAPPASGVLMFRLPQGSEVAVDGVPIGLSDGLGIISVTPGRHQVVLRVGGKETEHTVSVGTHRILTITPTSIVATEP